ncbi:MAG TPA: fructose-6-phosphate aldolase [Chloroflexota bacterium]|nr:fructose-6-phosphate aldolase [Chloroflexota bacterium]
MELFVDSADIREIEEAVGWGIISGVTTNPSLIAKEGKVDFKTVVQQICNMVQGPTSAEVISLDTEGMLKEAREIATWSPHVVIKIPMTWDGIRAAKVLSREGVKTNVTLVFSPNQALLAGLAGATYVSPFLGRLDDAGHDGMSVVGEIVEIYRKQGIQTKVLAASIRHPLHIVQAAKIGADVATVPFKVLKMMVKHPLTDAGIARFLEDWKKVVG